MQANNTTPGDAVPLLPELDSATGRVPAVPPAQWSATTDGLLGQVATSIKVPGLLTGEHSIDSIPDLWARPLLFELALLDSRHPLHKQVQGEWRGLLALLALREVRGLDFKAEALELPASAANLGRAPAFVQAATRLLPRRQLSEDTPWTNLYIFTYRGRAVGITSPTTLVCTAADCRGRFDSRVSWATEAGLQDPVPFLTATEKAALAHWLVILVTNLNAHPAISGREAGDLLNRLGGQLSKFAESLNSPPVNHEFSNRFLGLNTGFYTYLDKPLRAREVSLEESAARLVTTPGLKAPIGLLIVDPTIAEYWRVKPSEVPLFGRETLASIDFAALQEVRRGDKDKLRQLGQEVLRNAEWRTAAMLFSERLLLISSNQPFRGVREVEGQRNLTYEQRPVIPILPIASELLDYLSAPELEKRLSFFPEKNNAITVELRLPLAGPDGQARDFPVRHTYDANSIDRRSNFPVLEIWPHFRSEHWHLYYTYYDAALRRPQDIFVARPRIAGVPLDLEANCRSFQRGESDRREVTRLEAPPTAFVCSAYLPERREELEVGCLLLQELEFKESNGSIWSLGVDFGTSATHVYVQAAPGDEPSPLPWSDQLLQITPIGDSERDRLTNFFLPPFLPERPFPTLFRPDSGASQNWPFWQGNIRYVKPALAMLNDLKRNGIASGFKWSEDQALIGGFLIQLAAQSAAYAVERGASAIRWSISYPSAFSSFSEASLRNIWEEITERLNVPVADLRYQTESEAAARYFQHGERVSLVRTVCIDIGGGTSDISIWNNSVLLQQSSIKFAGESIFLDLLRHYPATLGAFGSEWTQQLSNVNKDRSFYAEAVSLFRASQREDLFKKLPILLASSRPGEPLYQFIHLLALGLSGLVFYAGLLLRRLRQEEKWTSDELPYLCVGGNGARIFNWLSLGRAFNKNTKQTELFTSVLRTAAEIGGQGRLDLRISSQPKAEVAYGLLKSERPLKKEEEAIIELAGDDSIDGSGTIVGWSSNLKPEVLAAGLSVPEDFTHLRSFVAAYNAYAATKESLASPVNFNEVAQSIRDIVQDELNEYKEQDPHSIVVKPLFITALKALLKVEAERWLGGGR